MKQSPSNPLQRELARTTPEGLHADANMLTAFAEGALLQRERQEVLAHLASCADCREALSVAVAAASNTAQGAETAPARPRHWLRRTGLLWAGAAAALVVALTLGILHEQKLVREGQSSVASNEPVNRPAQTPAPSPEMNAPVQPEKKSAERQGKPTQAPARLQAAPPAPQAAMRAPVMEESLKVEPSEGTAQQNSGLQENSQAVQSQGRSQQAGEGQVGSGAGEQSLNALQSARDSSAQNRSGQNQSAAPTAIAGSVSAFGNVEPSRAMAKAAIANLPRPHWRINAAGQAERSFGVGSWQRVLPDETTRMRVISVSGDDVWIGGEQLRLYRSRDNGATWHPVALPAKNGSDRGIVHIGFPAPATITVEAADGTAWTSTDGGATWK